MGPKLFFLDSVTRRSNGEGHVVCEVRPFWPPPKKKLVSDNMKKKSWWKKILFCFSYRLASIMGPKLFFLDSVTRRSNGDGHVVCQVRPFWPPPKKKLVSDNMKKKSWWKTFLFCFSYRLASIMGPELFFLNSVTRRSNGDGHVVCEVRPFWPPPKKKLVSDNMKKKSWWKKFCFVFQFVRTVVFFSLILLYFPWCSARCVCAGIHACD